MPYDPWNYNKQFEENPQRGDEDWRAQMEKAQQELEASQMQNRENGTGPGSGPTANPANSTYSQWGRRPQQGPRNRSAPAAVGGPTHRVPGTTVGSSGNGRQPSSNAGRVAAGGAAGVIGTPNLGSVSAMQQWAQQIDAMYGAGTAQRYLGQRGMTPTVNGQSALYDPAKAGMDTTPQDRAWLDATGGRGGMGGPQGSPIQQPNANGSFGASNRGSGLTRESFGMQQPGASRYESAGGKFGDLGKPGVAGQVEKTLGGLMSGKEDDLGGQIRSTLSGMLENPSGYDPVQEQMLRNRASEPIAGQQQENENATRMDAIRRGAASDDSDIRDQLNRVGAQGAKDQGDASFNVDRALTELSRGTKLSAVGAGTDYLGQRAGQQLGAASAGTGYLGQQAGQDQGQQRINLDRERMQQELDMMLAQLQQEQGNPLDQGFNFATGG